MTWIKAQNNCAVKLSSLPDLKMDVLRNAVVEECRNKKRPVAFFGVPVDAGIRVYAVLACDAESALYISSARVEKGEKFNSITSEIPAFHMFERELFEEAGIEPYGHPWLKPVRYSQGRPDRSKTIENYPFFSMSGEEVHEVAVGPVHAGIIEPGHFRFMCHGEKIYHLEIQLGYQHRGLEKMMSENRLFMAQIAESIAGDSVIAHTLAFANSHEGLSGAEIPERAVFIRDIALELERIAVHTGDLGAISNDIAYLPGSAVFGAARTLVINTMMAVCGSRFGRGLIRPGGVLFDIDKELSGKIKGTLEKTGRDVKLMAETMFDSASVLSRLEKTGIVDKETALKTGITGMSARASGVSVDIRADHPYGTFKKFKKKKIVLESGDVFARAMIRYLEIKESIESVYGMLDNMPAGGVFEDASSAEFSPDSMIVSLTEGWRGETAHIVLTDPAGKILKYKIKDPSFNNWFALALAVRNNGISDFPLCNKSFNLSYCGNDL